MSPNSWCCSPTHLSCFGSSNCDIVVRNTCETAVNYGTQDEAFEMKGRKSAEIFGTPKFEAKEIEVFQVTGGKVIV
jgi:hypothetical protein